MAPKPAHSFQTALPLDSLAWHTSAPSAALERGAIFTRHEVVAFILDLVGYTSDRPLTELRLLEPAFGQGDFLFLALDQLLTVWSIMRMGSSTPTTTCTISSPTHGICALQTVLRSGIAHLFVTTYSTQMRGGFLRFQAQYLRRIRIPNWSIVPEPLRKTLIAAAEQHDHRAGAEAVAELYGLSAAECAVIGIAKT